MIVIPQTAYAAVTINTSAGTFFGPSLIRFEIKDDALVGAPTDSILVTVTAKHGGSALGTVGATVTEIGSSGIFELFVTTSDSPLDPAAPTYATTGGIVVRINSAPTVDGNDAFITTTGTSLLDGDTVEVTYGGATRTVTFTAASASLTADRTTAGDGNKIVLSLADNDANTDPTAIDSFPTTGTILDLAAPNPITLATVGTAMNFAETGQNTGQFELVLNVNTPATTSDNFITAATLPTGKSLSVTDHDVYEIVGGSTAPYNAVTATSSVSSASVTLQNVDSIISTSAPVTFSNGIMLQIADADRNISTRSKDTPTGVFIEPDNAIAIANDAVDYTSTGATITTTVAPATGTFTFAQTLTFTSDPGTIATTDVTLGALAGTAANITPGAAAVASVTGTGGTRVITYTQAVSMAATGTNEALGTRTVTVAGIDNNVGLVAASGATPSYTGATGTAAVGTPNVDTLTIGDNNAGVLVAVPMQETGDNSGIFIPNLTGGKVAINIGAATALGTSSITLTAADAATDPDFGIVFYDPAADPSGAKVFRLIRTLSTTPGSLSGPTSVDITGKFALTINDSDLNTNPSTAETYTATFPGGAGATAPVALNSIAGMNTLGITRDNAAFTLPAAGLTVTFIETGANTNVFTASSVDMQTITSAITVEDGDQIKFTYSDLMESPSVDSDATITIGKPSEAISIDRTTLPIPMPLLAASPPFPAINADVVKFTLTVTDPTANTNTASTDTVTVTLTQELQSGGSLPANTLLINSGVTPIVLTETGVSTGVFTTDVTVASGSAFSVTNANGAKLKFAYGTQTASAILKSFDLSMSTSKTNVRNGDTLVITITDPDRNLDSATVDRVSFNIQAVDDDQTLVIFDADETGANTGIFTKTLVVGTDFKISTTSGSSISSATQIEIKSRDRIASDLTNPVTRERTISIASATGQLRIEPTNPGPGTKVKVSILDTDLDTSPTGTETIAASTDLLKITTDRTGIGTTSLGGKETGANTGVFVHEITFTPLPVTSPPTAPSVTLSGADKSTVTVLPGDIVSLRYTDETNSAGAKVTVSATFKIVSQDPTMKSSKTAVAVGDSFDVEINDVDANTDPDVLDTITLRVTSNSDAVGFETTAIETGPNTGVFTALLQTSDTVQAGSVTVGLGDSVQVKYSDKYPADYADRVKSVLDPSKDFFFNMSVGIGSGNTGSTSPSVPTLATASGQPVTSVSTGQQVVIRSTVQNNEAGPRAITSLVEVRDSDGITTMLGWSENTLPGNGQLGVGISWLPDQRGTYEVRIFVVSSLTSPVVLSEVIKTTVTVN